MSRKAAAKAKRLEIAFKTMYREESLRQQNFKCCYCRQPLDYKSVTADHIVPRSRGGQTIKQNIIAACRDCNYWKGSMSDYEFKTRIKNPMHWHGIQYHLMHQRLMINIRVELAEKRIMKLVRKG